MTTRSLALVLPLLLAATVGAQTAKYRYIEQKSPYWDPTQPELTALNLPRLGATFRILVPLSVDSGQQKVLHLLGVGLSSPRTPIPYVNGLLFTSAEVVMSTPMASSSGTTTMSFDIPDSPQLLGVRFYQQILRISLGASPLPPQLSRGGAGRIGK